MYFKGFKIAVSTNFIILLFIGMMLTNIVVAFFWQQHAITLSVKNAKSYLSLFYSTVPSYCGNSSDIDILFNDIKRAISVDSSISLHVLTPTGLYQKDKQKGRNVELFLMQALQSRAKITQSTGTFLSILGISPRDIIIALPLNHCNDVLAIGAVVHIPSIIGNISRKQPLILVYLLVNAIILATLWFFRARKLVFIPLERLIQMSEYYDLKPLDFRATTTRKNEFGQLADALKNMLARIEKDKEKLTQTVHSLEDANKQILENQNNLIEAEKFAAIGRLSAGLAHEIGNPLGIIQGYIELLGNDDISEEDRRQYSSRAEKELGRVTALIQQLLELARKKTGGKSSTRVLPVIHELLEMLAQQKSAQHIRFHVACEDFPEKVQCSEVELHQVLLNCMLNSVDAINEISVEEGKINVSCVLLDKESTKSVQIVIQDNGSGIDQDNLSSIFDPFFTTKAVGHGTGLGLSVSRSIIENCGGTIRLQSEKDIGTSVIIILPVV